MLRAWCLGSSLGLPLPPLIWFSAAWSPCSPASSQLHLATTAASAFFGHLGVDVGPGGHPLLVTSGTCHSTSAGAFTSVSFFPTPIRAHDLSQGWGHSRLGSVDSNGSPSGKGDWLSCSGGWGVGAVRCSDAEAASGWKGSQAVRGGQGLHSFAEQY